MTASQTHRASEDDAFGIALVRVSEVGIAAAELVANVVETASRLVVGVRADSRVVVDEAQALYEATLGAAVAARDALRATPRFARIVQEAVRLAAAYRLHASIRAAGEQWLGAAALQASLEDLHRDGAERLYRLCIDLRGGVLKLGQFASTRMDLLPDAYVAALSRLQDRVPAVPAGSIVERIEQEQGADIEDLFAEFDPRPVAAASIAQVHMARLDDGTLVAVKVQVPGIETLVETDLAALAVIVPLVRDILPTLDLDTIRRELTRALRAELDYRAEARHAAAFAACFAADPDVIVPAVRAERSSDRVLTLEFVDGERLVDFLDRCESSAEDGARDRDRIFTILLRSFCAQVLEHGLFQADPHPGNFLVVAGPDGPRLALLDFGNVQSYTARQRRAYAELALAILSNDVGRMTELFESIGFRSRSGDGASLRAFADLLLEAFREGAASEVFDVDPRARIERVLELTRENPVVQIPADFVQLGRVFASLGGLLMRYRPRVDLFQIILPQLLRAMQNSDLVA